MITWLEVVDDAVKIGSGAALGIILAKVNHAHEDRKERSRRRFDALERASDDLVEFHLYAAEMSSLLGFVMEQAAKQTAPKDYIEGQFARLHELGKTGAQIRLEGANSSQSASASENERGGSSICHIHGSFE